MVVVLGSLEVRLHGAHKNKARSQAKAALSGHIKGRQMVRGNAALRPQVGEGEK
jgi:hypothetical protein